jgi:rSAM/selenodomain-associated transferase 1
MTKDLLIIFAKNPVLGHCKTRLAAGIGAQNALDVYKILLAHTAAITQEINKKKVVFYSQEILENDIWDPKLFDKQLQCQGDLGKKMLHAFHWGFEQGYQNIVLIGTDLIDLKPTDIEEAFTSLDKNKAVFGPATDGGYYLIGLSEKNPKLFQNIPWSTSAVLNMSLKNLSLGSFHLLQPKNDIDQKEDLQNIPLFLQYIPLP